MKATATVEGISEFLKRMKVTQENIHKACKKGIDRTALAVESDAKKKLKSDGHIITGRLFSSIHAELKEGQQFDYTDKNGKSFDGSLKTEIDKLEAIAGTNVFYGPFIEFGTKYFSGDSFMGWAALNQSKLLKDRIIKELNKIKI
jgi:phage gpG-like protein